MRFLFPLSLLCLLGLTASVHAKSVPALLKLQAWRQLSVQGVDYISLQEVLDFYQFSPQAAPAGQEGQMLYANQDVLLALRTDSQNIVVDGITLQLLYPLRKDGRGELMLSKHDCVYLLDPILRPQYISPRQQLKRIIIDPCHSDAMEGIRPRERKEKADLALLYSLALEDKLKAIGYDVVLTRRADYYVSPAQRVEMANASEDSIFLCLSLNDYNAEYTGVECSLAVPRENKESDTKNAALGMSMLSHLVKWGGLKDGGLKRARYHVLSSVDVPAMSIALGNIGNVSERLALHDSAVQDKIVKALVQGIQIYAISLSEASAANVASAPEAPALVPVFHSGQSSGELETEEIDAEEIDAEEIDAVEVDAVDEEEIIAIDPDAQ